MYDCLNVLQQFVEECDAGPSSYFLLFGGGFSLGFFALLDLGDSSAGVGVGEEIGVEVDGEGEGDWIDAVGVWESSCLRLRLDVGTAGGEADGFEVDTSLALVVWLDFFDEARVVFGARFACCNMAW